MQKKLLLLSFIEGGAVMAAELCGAKLLAPIFGGSLYVWASVMGLTLAALAGGYFFGGNLAGKNKEPEKRLRLILSAAAITLLLMPAITYYLVPRLSYLSFLTGVIFSAMLLLMPAIFLLGATSPLFILLQTFRAAPELVEGTAPANPATAGKVSGTVYAVSTAGGILATFLCGFYLIPVLGLTITLLIFGIALFGANTIVFRKSSITELLFFAAGIYLSVQILNIKSEMLEKSESILGKLDVFDENRGQARVRVLRINDIIQTEMDLDTKLSCSRYVGLLDTLIPKGSVGEKAVVLGLGGGLTANLLVQKKYSCTGVEFDKRIAEAASRYFFLDPAIDVQVTDARQLLNRSEERYAVILADLFKAEEQPSYVLTSESLNKLKSNLSPNGKLYISWHGYMKGERGLGTAILLNTLERAGYFTQVCTYSENEDARNLIIVASLEPLPLLPYSCDEETTETALVNTDDCPRLEKYNAEANKAWRTSYLRYYQNRNN